jgi:hypothetical protein
MHEIKLMHCPPLPDDPKQADALRAISKWSHEKRLDALRKAYGPEFAKMSEGIEDMPDTAEKRQAVRALFDRFGPVDHCKVLKAGLSTKL